MGFIIFLFVILPIISLVGMYVYYLLHPPNETDNPESEEKGDTVYIGASVNRNLYERISGYCDRHNITIAALIRNAVKKYIDE